MGLISRILMQREDGNLEFFCPGCRMMHRVPLSGEVKWTWDGNEEAPTFYPSLHFGGVVRDVSVEDHYIATGVWKQKPKPYSCHSWVKEGQIQFLSDCSHNLAGQTVPMIDFHPDDL